MPVSMRKPSEKCDSLPESFELPQSFRPSVDLDFKFLTSSGRTTCLKILTVLAHLHPEIRSCPLLAPLVVILLHFLDEEQCFACATCLLTSKRILYLDQSSKRFEATKRSLVDLARSRSRSSFRYLISLAQRRSSTKLSLRHEEMYKQLSGWLTWLFECLPFPSLVRVCDCYFVEGPKVLYRVGLAIIKRYHNTFRSRDPPGGDVSKSVGEFLSQASLSGDDLLKAGFSIRRISRQLLLRYQSRNIAATRDLEEGTVGSPLALAPRLDYTSSIISSQSQFQLLWSWLPARSQVLRPTCLFDTKEHGYSLQTLYRKCGSNYPLLLLVKTSKEEFLGAFVSVEIEGNVDKFHYFGTGETFLFSLAADPVKYEWRESHPQSYFVAGDSSCFAIGGGGKGYGLWLDRELNRGMSCLCDTFCNDSLCSTGVDGYFLITSVEVYSFL
ncbi:GTPase-activating protein skywalker-like isoform X2 [Oscarella lobularis]|uniref:GTPase-activating protein skywalker-like isoform X2 n=1 Tax=Oscarella lobularis TaxID=121494 RepID=UPI0033135B28